MEAALKRTFAQPAYEGYGIDAVNRPGLKPQGYRTTQAKARFSGRRSLAPPIYGGAASVYRI